ncbi:MAG: 2OG-Fe(II) oxygenase [Oceanicaulis sp.]
MLRLNPTLKLAPPAKTYARMGLAVIDSVLAPDDAEALAEAMIEADGFSLAVRLDGVARRFDLEEIGAMEQAERAAFEARLAEGARTVPQHRYECFDLSQAGRDGRALTPIFAAALALVESEAFLALARRVCWRDTIAGVEARLTRFQPGHFETRHDDDAPRARRVAAFALHLCRDWRADHGGVLNFFGGDEEVRRGVTPGFNRLILYSVPRPHAVSMVAPFAPRPRLALSGWLTEGRGV